jgi:molecular chaperone GrpE
MAALEAELAEAKDRVLRALAETENVRRRAERERTDALRFGAGNIAKDLLSVADNLRRALDSAPAAPDEATKNLLAGVAATERELMAAFERNGIRRVEPKLGDRFDPNQHEAMFEVPNTGHAAGSIVQVLQPGYMIQDRLLRPAMVGVAKAEPGAAEPRRFDEVV